MAVDLHITINGTLYAYSPDAIRAELSRRGVGATEIEQVLTEIAGGNVTAIRNYGLSEMFVGPGGALLLPSTLDAVKLASLLESDNIFNMLQVMFLLHETSKELREANREMRHADRDAAMTEALMAADKIRSAALVNLVMGVVQGSISIGMGVFSLGASIKAAATMRSTFAEAKSAAVEMNQIKADHKLGTSQVELQKTTAEIKLAETRIEANEQGLAQNAERQITLDADVKSKEANVTRAQTEYATALKDEAPGSAEIKLKQEALGHANGDLKPAKTAGTENQAQKTQLEAEIKADTDKLAQLNKTKSELETRIPGEAAEAQKANKARIESLEKSTEADAKLEKRLSEQIDKADGKADDKALAELKAEKDMVGNRLKADQAKLEQCRANEAVYRNPTSPMALEGAAARVKAANVGLDAVHEGNLITLRHQNAQAALNKQLSQIQTTNTRLQSAQMGVGGINQILKGVGDYLAAEEQALGAEYTARGQKRQASEQENIDFQKAAAELIAEVRTLLQKALQAQNQANSAIYRNM